MNQRAHPHNPPKLPTPVQQLVSVVDLIDFSELHPIKVDFCGETPVKVNPQGFCVLLTFQCGLTEYGRYVTIPSPATEAPYPERIRAYIHTAARDFAKAVSLHTSGAQQHA